MQLTIRISPEQLDIIEKISKEFNKPRNSAIQEAINCYISMYLQGNSSALDKDTLHEMVPR